MLQQYFTSLSRSICLLMPARLSVCLFVYSLYCTRKRKRRTGTISRRSEQLGKQAGRQAAVCYSMSVSCASFISSQRMHTGSFGTSCTYYVNLCGRLAWMGEDGARIVPFALDEAAAAFKTDTPLVAHGWSSGRTRCVVRKSSIALRALH